MEIMQQVWEDDSWLHYELCWRENLLLTSARLNNEREEALVHNMEIFSMSIISF